MPLHDYKCGDCGEIKEFMVPMQSAGDYDVHFACECGGLMYHKITAPGYMKIMSKSSTLQKALTFPNRER